jgi:hypothetical protein
MTNGVRARFFVICHLGIDSSLGFHWTFRSCEPELDAIWEYIAIDNMDAAGRFIEAACGTFQELAQMPGMGWKREFSQARLGELRTFRVKGFENYPIF